LTSSLPPPPLTRSSPPWPKTHDDVVLEALAELS
jgi:hypothetical protein